MFLSQDAHDNPFNGFFVNMASSSFYLGLFFVINSSNMLFIYTNYKFVRIYLNIYLTFFSRLLSLLLVSFLSANIPKNFCSISLSFSSNLASKRCKSCLSAFLDSYSRLLFIFSVVSSLKRPRSDFNLFKSSSIYLINASSMLCSFLLASAMKSSSFFVSSLIVFFCYVSALSTYSILFLNNIISLFEGPSF